MIAFAQAWRSLLRRRLFTITTLATLALGIAVTTTVFSVVHGVLLRPLPFPDAGQLVAVYEASPGRRERVSLVAPVRLEDWNRMSTRFEAISGSYRETVTDTSGAEPERLDGRRVMPRFFDVFGMPPLAGRTFVPDEERYGGRTAVVISEGFWARRFGRNAAAIGARLLVGGTGYTIVGVMPRQFTSAAIDVWMPAQLAPAFQQFRAERFIGGVGRLKRGVTLADGAADLARVQAELGVLYPRTDKDWSVDVRDLKEVGVGEYRRAMLMVFGAVGVLFAIAIANVAGLMLVQLQRRASELAIRAAIGASRRQVIAAVMREAAIVAALGAAAGGALAWWLTRAASTAFPSVPRMAEVSVDLRALAFAAGSGVAAAVMFGLLPALAATRATLPALLSFTGRGGSTGRHRLQAGIVVAQLALGVVLAGTAGLLVRSYGALSGVDVGFDASNVLTFHAGAAWSEDRMRVRQFQQRLITELQRMPGVRAAGYVNFLPGTGATLRSQVSVAGLSGDEPNGVLTVGSRTVTGGYLRALSIPLVAGEWCADVPEPPPAPLRALVNRQFVARFAAGQNVIGRELTFTQFKTRLLIAGIVGDVREDRPSAAAVPYVYACLPLGSWPDPEYVVHATGDPRLLIGSIRQIVKTLDPARPVFGVKLLSDVMEVALDQPRHNASLLTTFAAAALVLASLGLYGLLSLLVAERRRELGVRKALGASPRDLVTVVVFGAGRLVAGGVATGCALLLGAGFLLRTLLFGVAPYDLRALGWSVAALGFVSLVAMIVPARQAARVSAMEAMKNG
jgi:putative ABC transport system permease protein